MVVTVLSLAQVKEHLQDDATKFSFCILDIGSASKLQEELSHLLLTSRVPTIVVSDEYQQDLGNAVFAKGLFDYIAKDDIVFMDTIIRATRRYQDNHNKDILVIEDPAAQYIDINRFFKQHGYTVRSASNTAAALELLEQFATHLVVIDFDSVTLDGVAFLKALRQQYSRHQLGIIGIFSRTEQRNTGQWIKYGANDFLLHPLQLQELLFRCEQCLEKLDQFTYIAQLAQLQEHVFDNVIDAIITTDENGRVLHCNSAAEVMFGFPIDKVIGKHVADYIAPKSHKEQLTAAIASYANSEFVPTKSRQRIEIPGQHANDAILDLEMTISISQEQEKNRFILFVNDITSKKQLKTALRETLEVAETSNATIKAFLANIGHEIRNPMNAVLGFTDLALTTSMSPKTISYLDKIENSSRSMMGIINNILEYSQIWSGNMELNLGKFDLHHLFDRLADLFSKQLADRDLELILLVPADYDKVLYGDVVRLEQVLINLIRNAIKFTPRGNIIVTVEPHTNDKKQVTLHFTVEDTGIGISPEYTPLLFNPYFQHSWPTTNQNTHGTGLGLSICYQLINLMDGTISVKSKLGHGSTFTFHICVDEHSDNKRTQLAIPENLHGKRALVVDDNPATLQHLSNLLTRVSLIPTAFRSGKKAMQSLFKENNGQGEGYAVAFIDWQMQEMNGIDLTAHMLAEMAAAVPEITPPQLFFLLTPFGNEQLRNQGAAFGINGYIDKPFTRSRLVQAISGAMEKDIYNLDRRSKVALKMMDETGDQVVGGRVLLAEDNLINQQVIRELMERLGLIVETAQDGLEAVRMVEKYPFDIVLMDIQLHSSDGCETTKTIRSRDRLQNLPIIAITGHSQPEDIKKYLAAGMNANLSKPIRPERLFGMISQWVPPRSPVPEILTTTDDNYTVPDIFGLDNQAGLEHVAGNRKLYFKLLNHFIHEYSDAAKRCTQAFANGEMAELDRIIHCTKGVARNIGAVALSESVNRLETIINKGDGTAIRAALSVFGNRLADIIIGLQGETVAIKPPVDIQEFGLPPTISENRDKLAPLLQELAIHLDSQSIEIEHLLTASKALITNSSYEILWLELENHVENYNFSEALELLSRLAAPLDITLETNFPFARSNPDRQRVLIVDDQLINIDILKNILKGFDLFVATNGKQAIKIANSKNQPDIILLDIVMPLMDGYEVCQQLKDSETSRHIPIIFVTIKQTMANETQGLKMGAIDYIVKPFHPSTVRQRVKNHLMLSQYREHLEQKVAERTAELTKTLKELTAKKAQLVHTGRLTAMGEMATGVAHELSQPLSSIRVWLQNLQLMSKGGKHLDNNDIANISNEVIAQVDRANTIITNMRTFAYGEKTAPALPIDLVQPINKALSFFQEQFQVHGIELSADIAKDLPKIAIHANRFEQIVVNLLSNARFAVDKKQQKNDKYRKKIELRLFFNKTRNSVTLLVKDNGIGMNQETKTRCLEPFFTTKDAQVGTGLGLYITRDIVIDAKGELKIESKLDHGSQFRVDLPTTSFEVEN